MEGNRNHHYTIVGVTKKNIIQVALSQKQKVLNKIFKVIGTMPSRKTIISSI